MKKTICSLLLLTGGMSSAFAQDYWQMKARYVMSVDFFADRHQYRGRQVTTLYNGSPDTLQDLFFHLYPNAFQPGSDMDVRSRSIEDPDPRVGTRIQALKPEETGFIRPEKIQVKGKEHAFEIEGTILRIRLSRPVLPGDSCQVNLRYLAQVPSQIRRSGRFNREGVDYSMAQWYPKLCEYDRQGWHTDPYVGREFYAPWSDFDVTLRIDSKYTVAATGYLADDGGARSSRKWKTWRFTADRVHDFVWAADPDYVRQVRVLPDGRLLLFYHIPNAKYDSAWSQLPFIMQKALEFIEPRYGPYPYRSYSFIQGGDGGMEYPMATLILGNRPLNSLVGLCLHEWMHTWFQMLLATNEALYPWMDEGFTSFAEAEVKNHIDSLGLIPGTVPVEDPMRRTLEDFVKFSKSGREEALCTHADHYQTNRAYGVASYSKGALCLHELRYILGEKAFSQGMLDYYWTWRFRHPGPDDFFRVMEKASGIELDWFQHYWVHTTRTMDYSIDSVEEVSGGTLITLRRIGSFPMPVDLVVEGADGPVRYTIPLDLMRGSKPTEGMKVLPPWHWVETVYRFKTELPFKRIRRVEIDPGIRMADIDRDNNAWSGRD